MIGGPGNMVRLLPHRAEVRHNGFYVYPLCRAKVHPFPTETQICGIYMPSPLWLDAGRHRYYCHPQWDNLQNVPGGGEILTRMAAMHGEDRASWPNPCCGARFRPWTRGSGCNILEINIGHSPGVEEWVCFVAENIPAELDLEIKKHLSSWHEAMGELTYEEIEANIPFITPRMHAINGIVGIARFNIDGWTRKGCPTVTETDWKTICKIIAEKKPEKLRSIITLCTTDPLDKRLTLPNQPAHQLASPCRMCGSEFKWYRAPEFGICFECEVEMSKARDEDEITEVRRRSQRDEDEITEVRPAEHTGWRSRVTHADVLHRFLPKAFRRHGISRIITSFTGTRCLICDEHPSWPNVHHQQEWLWVCPWCYGDINLHPGRWPPKSISRSSSTERDGYRTDSSDRQPRECHSQ